MKIYYATSNLSKFAEVNTFILKNSNIQLEHFNIDLPEIQTLNQYKIALDKAQQAWNLLKKPVLVDDAGVYLNRYKNFPGVMSKFINQTLGFHGILKLAEEDNKAYKQLTLIYMDANGHKHFIGSCKGTIVPLRNTGYSKELPWNSIFLPDGSTKTEAELEGTPEKEIYNYRLQAIKQFIKWYNDKANN